MTPKLPGWKPLVAAAVSAALFVPLLVFGGIASARSGAPWRLQYSGSAEYQYGTRVQLCHRTHSRKHPWRLITVGAPAVKAHLRHGDQLPPCSEAPAVVRHGHGRGDDETTTTTATTTVAADATESGDDGGHGHSQGKGGHGGKGKGDR